MAERSLPVVVVTLARSGAVVARAEVADTAETRRRGLLGRDGLAPGTGLLIRPCGAIHTWFMRFPIDAVFLRRDGTVTRVRTRIRPFRLAWGGWRADDTLELPAGAAEAGGIRPGDRLEIGRA